jgi:hypothetical protein
MLRKDETFNELVRLRQKAGVSKRKAAVVELATDLVTQGFGNLNYYVVLIKPQPRIRSPIKS